jgi:hypothetical protein
VTDVLHHVPTVDGSLLDIACGLEAVIRRFDALLDRYAAPGGSASDHSDSPLTELVLGFIAVRGRIADALATSATAEPPPREGRSMPEDSWLR